MKFSDLAGSIETHPEDASSIIKAWFGPDDLVYLTGKRTVKVKSDNIISQGAKAREIVEILDSDQGRPFLDSLVQTDDGTQWNVYLNISPARSKLNKLSERLKQDNVDHVVGVIADLDVKVGGFADENQIKNFLNGLVAKPTIVVSSGSGGMHAYWKFTPGREAINVDMGRDTAERWWTYLDEEAMKYAGAHVDKLYDMARMLRLPGTVRWPRTGENASPSPVRLVWCDGSTHVAASLREHSEAAWGRRLERVSRTRKTDKEAQFSADQLAGFVLSDPDNPWVRYQAIAHVEDYFSEKVSWDDILNKAGWTRLRTDSQGRVEWARPGRDEKSATVDWPESPDVMSLLSTSHDTRMLDLLDAGIPLTKWRVALRLLWNDNYSDMVRWTLARMGI